MRNKSICLIFTGMLVYGGAWARPVYAIKEGKPCVHCHVNPKGGGPRNVRGAYYAAHNHSFEGYDEAKVVGTGIFHQGWQDTLPATALKIGVGDLLGDGTLRLVILGTGDFKRQRVITVKKWAEKDWVDEYTTTLGDPTERMAVGKYGIGKNAIIVTPSAMVYWDGKAYVKKPSPRNLPIIGTVTMRDGTERLILREGDTIKLFTVKPEAEGSQWLSAPMDAPPSSQTVFTDMKGSTEELENIGMPPPLARGGVVGLWDSKKSDSLFLYGVQLVAVVEGNSQATKPEDLVIKGKDVYLTIVDPRSTAYRNLWHSDKLKGAVLDITIRDPRNGDPGILVLTDGSDDGKGHTLTFYKLH